MPHPKAIMDIEALFKKQKEHRWSMAQTRAFDRRERLKKLKAEILKRREDIKLALFKDFKKPYAETELTEIHPVLDEINFAIKHLKKWMRPKRVPTPFVLWGARSFIHYEPKGVVLVLSPWNYPFALLINPLVAAIAAGNCVMARPSEKTPHTSGLLKEIIAAVFDESEVVVVLGEIEVAQKLLELPFDHIFFTGSTGVGKKIMAAAAAHLTSVTLELGGKSPVIIDRNVDLKLAAQKITWGKFLNAGQTCVAPDYCFVPVELKDELISLLKEQVAKHYGELNEDLAYIIDQRGHERLEQLLKKEKNLLPISGNNEQNYLSPFICETNFHSDLMKEEIFGPVLPLITYERIEDVLSAVQTRHKPLALYIFSNEKTFIKSVLSQTSSGGAVVNDVIIHLANPYLPFGGVGHSGLGSYHGQFGHRTFSHEKSVLVQARFSLLHLYYPPYSRGLSRIAFKFLRLFE